MAAARLSSPHHVVVVGGGFGGLAAVQALRDAPVRVTLVDRRNFHLFQPLLYQVATGALAPGEIASPLRGILKRQRNARVVLAEVAGFDLEGRRVLLAPGRGRGGWGDEGADGGSEPEPIEYDTLLVAAGVRYQYFGHPEWEGHAPGLKTLEDALEIRRRILTAFEAAEIEPDPERRRTWLTFVVVGAGPTGVELAGQIGEMARDTLPRDFRAIDPSGARTLLVETADRALTGYDPRLSARTARDLARLGVELRTGHTVVAIEPDAVTLRAGPGEPVRVPARTVIWAAGVEASPLAAALAAGLPEAEGRLDGSGRVSVGPDLTLPGHPEAIAFGDMARVGDGHGGVQTLPGVAPVAMQQGRYAAALVRARLRGPEAAEALGPFAYHDRGNLATIGRASAVAEVMGLRLTGLVAWLTWLFVHLLYLVGMQNRLLVFIRWSISFVTRGRGSRLITGDR